MDPQRYRCAPILVLAVAVLFAVPRLAPADGFDSAFREIADVIDMERDRLRSEIRQVDQALDELRGTRRPGRFADGIRQMQRSTEQPQRLPQGQDPRAGGDVGGGSGSQMHHPRGSFDSGLRSARHEVAEFLRMERHMLRSEMRHLDRALPDLLGALDQRPHGRFANGARSLTPRLSQDGAGMEPARTPNGIGDQLAKKAEKIRIGPNIPENQVVGKNGPTSATMPGSAKQGPGRNGKAANIKTETGKNADQACAKNDPGNLLSAKAAGKKGSGQQAQPMAKNLDRNTGPGSLVGARPSGKKGQGQQTANNKIGASNTGPGSRVGARTADKKGQGQQTANNTNGVGPGNLVGARTADKKGQGQQTANNKNGVGPGNLVGPKGTSKKVVPNTTPASAKNGVNSHANPKTGNLKNVGSTKSGSSPSANQVAPRNTPRSARPAVAKTPRNTTNGVGAPNNVARNNSGAGNFAPNRYTANRAPAQGVMPPVARHAPAGRRR